MELKDYPTKDADERDLQAVVEQIRPLPENVVPSEQFLAKMRLRLLRLSASSKRPASGRAA